MAENRLEGEVIGVIFDGAGYGPDGKIWGGEFLLGSYGSYRRLGHFREVPMPGGDAASREPYRMALAYLFDIYRDRVFDLPVPCLERIPDSERKLFLSMLAKGINSPFTSSCGRLFDAAAALLGHRSVNSYEGQGAMELEGVAERGASAWNYPYAVNSTGSDSCFSVDFRLTIDAILADQAAAESRPVMARRFHDTVAAAAADACLRIRRESGVTRVVLSGGVFQNKLLTERLHRLLTQREFQVYTHRLVPPNDGGLALGQAVVAGWMLKKQHNRKSDLTPPCPSPSGGE
jgi:hydrogenase maturation protein HypF